MTKKDWLHLIHAGDRVYLNDLELTGLTHYDIRADANEPVRLTLELYIQPPGTEIPEALTIAIAERLLGKK